MTRQRAHAAASTAAIATICWRAGRPLSGWTADVAFQVPVSIYVRNRPQVAQPRQAQVLRVPDRSVGVRRQAIFTSFISVIGEYPAIFLAEIVAVVLLSTLFETWTSWARRELALAGNDTGNDILKAVYKEITGLGFIGLFLFLVTRTGTADDLAKWALAWSTENVDEKNPLAETFETVHIIIFMLLIVLIFQAAAISFSTANLAELWDEYERKRAFGENRDSLESEFISNGYLEKVPNPDAPRGFDLALKKPFKCGSTFWENLQNQQDPLHQTVMWRAIRHEFLFPSDKSNASVVPDPALFSFTGYICTKMGRSVLALVELDVVTWLLAFVFSLPVLIVGYQFPSLPVEALLCLGAWLLLLFGYAVSVKLEEENFRLTPTVPEDPRMLLRLFAGTSSSMLMRQKGSQTFESADANVKNRTMGALGLGGCELEAPPKLGRCPAYQNSAPTYYFVPTNIYKNLFELYAFLQAVLVTALIIVLLSRQITEPANELLCAFTLLEWPIMLFDVVPNLIKKLTIRNSVELKKDDKLIRKVTLNMKEGFLRDYVRLIQVISFEKHASSNHAEWATKDSSWTPQQSSEAFQKGLDKFRDLPQQDKLEIWKVFERWDVNNDEALVATEIFSALNRLGFAFTEESANNMIRLVDHDSSEYMCWRKFKALTMLSTYDRPFQEQKEDLRRFFEIIDDDHDKTISVAEMSAWSQQIGFAMSEDDFSNLLYRHFGRAKPRLDVNDFIDWVGSLSGLNKKQTLS